jgi:anti-sigma factor (TIGR02949 family)
MSDDCGEVLTRLERYLDGECPAEVEQLVRGHLLDCPPCFDRADFQREVRELIAAKCREKAPPALLARVLARLDQLSS